MAREDFIDNLRLASRTLPPPSVWTGRGPEADALFSFSMHSADLWLTPKSVAGFDPADFSDWRPAERAELERDVAAFLEVAKQVSADQPATKGQSKQARKHLEHVIGMVGKRLLGEWLAAQQNLMAEATSAAKAKGWFVEKDEKDVRESLLGAYRAPRLRIRTQDNEVVLDPIARFGSGRQGVVDLVVMPTYETKYLVAFKDGHWQIVSPERSLHARPFTRKTLVNTITRLAHR